MKRLYRSRRDKVLLGVCGGIAHYFGVDPVLVRVIWLLVSLGPFPGILAYLVAAILMPAEPEMPSPTPPRGGPTGESGTAGTGAGGGGAEAAVPPGEGSAVTPGAAGGEAAADERQRERTVRLLGWGLVVLGAVLLIYNWSVMAGMGHMLRRYLPSFTWHFWWGLTASWWPLLLIALGAAILWRGLRRSV